MGRKKKSSEIVEITQEYLDSLDYGVLDKNGVPVVSSRHVASVFRKRHADVIRAIENIIDPDSGLSKDFTERNFALSNYKDTTGRKLKEYLLTRDGFTMVVMGFTGKEAMMFKEAYIKRFNEMEEKLESLKLAKLEYPQLTAAIKEAHEDPQFYHFTNEIDMINRIVLGMSAKQFRELHNIKKGASIRPYLTAHQISLVEKLQRFNTGLVAIEPDFQKRKEMLTTYYNRLTQTKSIDGLEPPK